MIVAAYIVVATAMLIGILWAARQAGEEHYLDDQRFLAIVIVACLAWPVSVPYFMLTESP